MVCLEVTIQSLVQPVKALERLTFQSFLGLKKLCSPKMTVRFCCEYNLESSISSSLSRLTFSPSPSSFLAACVTKSRGNLQSSRAAKLTLTPFVSISHLQTSGTTGKPKGVLSTQRQCISCLSLAGYAGARALVARRAVLPPPPAPGLDPDSAVLLILVPLFHTT